MNLDEATSLARSEMDKNGLQDWSFEMNYNMKTTFGRCNIWKKTISLSAILTHLNVYAQVLDTINHEIAHALRETERNNIGTSARQLTPSIWHDPRWSQIAKQLGSDGRQFYNSPGYLPTVTTGKVKLYPWRKVCPNCGVSGGLTQIRKKKSCCRRCYDATGQYIRWNYVPNEGAR